MVCILITYRQRVCTVLQKHWRRVLNKLAHELSRSAMTGRRHGRPPHERPPPPAPAPALPGTRLAAPPRAPGVQARRSLRRRWHCACTWHSGAPRAAALRAWRRHCWTRRRRASGPGARCGWRERRACATCARRTPTAVSSSCAACRRGGPARGHVAAPAAAALRVLCLDAARRPGTGVEFGIGGLAIRLFSSGACLQRALLLIQRWALTSHSSACCAATACAGLWRLAFTYIKCAHHTLNSSEQESFRDGDDAVAALGLEAVGALCAADALDFYGAWRVVHGALPALPAPPRLAAAWIGLLAHGGLDAAAHPEKAAGVVSLLWAAADHPHALARRADVCGQNAALLIPIQRRRGGVASGTSSLLAKRAPGLRRACCNVLGIGLANPVLTRIPGAPARVPGPGLLPGRRAGGDRRAAAAARVRRAAAARGGCGGARGGRRAGGRRAGV